MVDQITEALAKGQKIQAIKIYCDATGKRLKEGKEFIDELIPALVERDPDRFSHLTKKGAGCGSAVMLLAAGLACCLAVMMMR
ncbi:MAG: hypothetical protein RIK87_19985 [Fuerstiella sp.]